MPPFSSKAPDTKIQNSTFFDVRGNLKVHNGDVHNIQKSETGLLELFRASAPGAAFNSLERSPPPRCHPGTRKEILDKVKRWTDGPSKVEKIVWLHGPAGSGKSAIAQTIAETCAASKQLAASFFFSKGSTSRANPRLFFTTIALQLALSTPDKRDRIRKAVEDDPCLVQTEHANQMKRLIIDPLLSLVIPGADEATHPPFLVIIDGLDECDGQKEQVELLSHILQLVTTHRVPLSFLIISRPEQHIRAFFDSDRRIPQDILTRVSLYDDFQAQEDVHVVLRDGFSRICASGRHDDVLQGKAWPSDEDIRLLARRSGGYFIYASTVLNYVDDDNSSCVDRLKGVINTSSTDSAVFAELDKLYLHILSRSPEVERLSFVLGALLVPTTHYEWQGGPNYHAVHRGGETIETIAVFLDLQPGEVMATLRGLHSVVRFSTTYQMKITATPMHNSFQEFLFDKTRAGKYYLDLEKAHADIVDYGAKLVREWDSRLKSSPEVNANVACQPACSAFWFTENPVMIPVIYLVIEPWLDHLNHLTGGEDQEYLLANVRDSIKTWNPWNSASNSDQWPSAPQAQLLKYLGNSIQCSFNMKQGPYKDLVRNQFIKLLDLGFETLEDFPESVPMIQALLMLPWQNLPISEDVNQHVFRQYLKRCGFPEADFDSHLNLLVLWPPIWESSLYNFSAAGYALRKFLTDRKRSGWLYSDETERHTLIANNWLLWLKQGLLMERHDSWARDIVLENWSKFLTNSDHGNADLISRLRDFDLSIASKASTHDADRVIWWLERSKNAPEDVLLRWKMYQASSTNSGFCLSRL